MASQADRRALHAYVSDTAHDHWHDFAAEQGVSVSAILESLAAELGLLDEVGTALDAVVVKARRIDAKRRRRTKI